MLKGSSLIQIVMFVKHSWISRVHNRLDKVSCVINFDNRAISFASDRPPLNPILSFQLEHFSSLAHQIIPNTHRIGQLLLKLLEALKLNEPNRIYGALGRDVELVCGFGQQRKGFRQIDINLLFVYEVVIWLHLGDFGTLGVRFLANFTERNIGLSNGFSTIFNQI